MRVRDQHRAGGTTPSVTPAQGRSATAGPPLALQALGTQKGPLDLFAGFAVAPRPRKGEG